MKSKLLGILSLGFAVLVIHFWPSLAASNIQTPEDRILSKAFEAYMDGHNKVALDYFEEVMRINPKNRAAKEGLTKVKERLKKNETQKKESLKKFATTKVKEGRELLLTNDVIGAIDAFHEALHTVPNHKKATKEMKSLRKRLQKAVERKKMNLTEWSLSRGAISYIDQDWSRAYRIWSERLVLDPNNESLASATHRAEDKFVQMMQAEKEEFLRRGAREFYQQGLYTQAMTSWEKVLGHRSEDKEALQGLAKAEEALRHIQGKSQNKKVDELLEQALKYYANQKWGQAKSAFEQLVQLDPDSKSARHYLIEINKKVNLDIYTPVPVAKNQPWRPTRASNQGGVTVAVPESLENLDERKKELQSQLARDPSNIRIQQELDKLKGLQKDESERIYKDGLIAYSQGNRGVAMDKWKQVLVLDPAHKKAEAALRKAKAEYERTGEESQ